MSLKLLLQITSWTWSPELYTELHVKLSDVENRDGRKYSAAPPRPAPPLRHSIYATGYAMETMLS